MRKILTVVLMFCLLVSLSGCLEVTDAPIPPQCPLFYGILKSSVGHSYVQDAKPSGDLFMKPTNFNIVDDSRVLVYTYNDFAKANPALNAKAKSTENLLALDYDLEKAFVLVFDMHVTTGNSNQGDLKDHYGKLYFIVGAIQNDRVVKGISNMEKFKLQGIGGSFQGFFAYQCPRDNAMVVAPWMSVSAEGKVKYDSNTGEPLFMELKGIINGVIPGQVIFEIPFQTETCNC